VADRGHFCHRVGRLTARQDSTPSTQRTAPRGKDKNTGQPYEPTEIPVPTRKEVEDLMRGAIAKPAKADDQDD
jgi:hypothetical protein